MFQSNMCAPSPVSFTEVVSRNQQRNINLLIVYLYFTFSDSGRAGMTPNGVCDEVKARKRDGFVGRGTERVGGGLFVLSLLLDSAAAAWIDGMAASYVGDLVVGTLGASVAVADGIFTHVERAL
jgi:hypothetical protein